MDRNRPHRSPAGLHWQRDWRQLAQRVWRQSRHDHLSVIAAGCAFYAFFALFPALSAVISIYGIITDPATVEDTFDVLSAILPPQAYEIVIGQIRHITESPARVLGWNLALSLLLALWSTNTGVQAIFTALNIAHGERERRSAVHYYATALIFSIAAIAAGIVMLLALVYMPLLFASVGFSREFELSVRIGRWPFLAALILIFLELLYRYGPSRRKVPDGWVSIGSVFATAICLAATVVFSLYVTSIGNYNKTYGSLGAVIVMLLWLYICFYFILLGGQINAASKNRRVHLGAG
jgi:membrane protein